MYTIKSVCFTLLLLLIASTTSRAQNNIKFYFRLDSHIFEPHFSQNAKELERLDSLMYGDYVTVGLDSLELVATASIDGPEKHNTALAKRRAQTMSKVLTERYPQIKKELFTSNAIPENWVDLRAMIAQDDHVPYKEEVLKVIDSNQKADAKEFLLKSMRGRIVWNYLKIHILPKQRYGASVVFSYSKNRETLIRQIEEYETEIVQQEPYIIRKTTILRDSVHLLEKKYRPIALKTNLLYDVLGAVNLELEIPIGQRWSIGAEVIYPWWYGNKNNFTERIRQGHLSVTYWLGDRNKWDYLTGWNVGVFGGYGDYDVQLWDMKGVQGDLINTGINIGFAHNINKKGTLHLHYQLGVGYARSDYREYTKYWDTKYGDVKVFDYPWEVKRRTWIGPTQAEVSLVWMINFGRNKSLLGRKKGK